MKAKDILIIVLLLGIIGFLFWDKMTEPRIGYVRLVELLENYEGMQEAALLYNEKQSLRTATLDSLKREHQVGLETFKAMYQGLSEEERVEREKRLGLSQQTIYQYAQSIENQAAQDDEKLTGGVLNQVSEYIEEYGKANGYTVILGTNMDGNILYGEEAIDLTATLTDELNKQYSGES